MKKNQITKLLSLLMVLVLFLTGCGGGKTDTSKNDEGKTEVTDEKPEEKEDETSGEEIKDLVLAKLATRELTTFNYLYSQEFAEFESLANMVDGLLEVDIYGKLVPALAEEWGTEDEGLTWTFKLRDGVKWVDMNGEEKGDTVANDFATGLEWVLNFHKNDSKNTSMPMEMIKGATEYYEYTKELSAEEAKSLTAEEGSKFREMVGLETPDELTVVYHCISKKPYFDTVGAYACLYPMAQGMIDELGGADGVKGMDNTNIWYNGGYTMTQYIQGNEKVLTKNPLYWDTESDRFDTVTIKMVESLDVAYQLYQTGEVDYTQLSESQVTTISQDKNHEFHDYLVPDVPPNRSVQFHFNYNKYNSEGEPDVNWNTAVANKAFRLSWYYGLDLKDYFKRTNPIDPFSCENNYYSMKGLVYTSDGTEYTELVRNEIGLPEPDGEKMTRLDRDKAEEYKAQAVEELTALGVTFPVEIDYYIMGSDQIALDTANVLKQVISDGLGDDFAVLNIKTYVSKHSAEVFKPHLHSIGINGWGADYGDPQNYLVQEVYGNDNAYYSASITYINEVTEETEANKELLEAYREYTKMVEEADAITDNLDERYKAYAKAEALLLENALTVPAIRHQLWALSKVDNSSKMNAMYGIQNEKMKNWKTNTEGYTTEKAAKLQAERDAGVK